MAIVSRGGVYDDGPTAASSDFQVPYLGNYLLDRLAPQAHTCSMKEPKSLQEAILYFADFENCKAFMVCLRWPDGVVK
ncbi:MAG: hypothetical protein WCC92_10845, partial [Candidatus Korobacteraceae bacterium]